MIEKSCYDWQEHLNPNFPSQIICDVTEYCNLECIHCPHPSFKRSDAWNGRHLDLAVHKQMVDEIDSDGRNICKYVRYTANGEPLIHPKFIDMIAYNGKHKGTSAINVTTNGMALTEKKARALLDAGVDAFDISIDAFNESTYSRVRIKGNLDVTRKHVLKLIDLIQKGNYDSKVVVSYVEQPLNKNETDLFEQYWKGKGASYVVIRRLHSCAGAKEKISEKMKAEKTDVRRPCLYPWERLVLSPSGQIGFCPADWKYQGKIAYLKGTTIKDIWQGAYMKSLRDAHLTSDYKNHEFCGQCPDWAATRWPHEGRSYSNMMHEIALDDFSSSMAISHSKP
uniref:Iron-sulfur cluster-binding domain-containing protein n=1 Tax=Candidatus Kentrum sp. FW TaxID=2126338 RepID=A0A450TCT3_9GAMM|nr:MAG: Iron-sulfur cluster-binding domain-containing protein [Candidatus Kentron sp. FW]